MEPMRNEASKPKSLSIAVIIYYSYVSFYDAVSRGREQNMAGLFTVITHVWALIFEENETNSSQDWKPINNIKKSA